MTGLCRLRVRYCCGSAQLVSSSWPEAPLHSKLRLYKPHLHARTLSCPGEGGRGTSRHLNSETPATMRVVDTAITTCVCVCVRAHVRTRYGPVHPYVCSYVFMHDFCTECGSVERHGRTDGRSNRASLVTDTHDPLPHPSALAEICSMSPAKLSNAAAYNN